MLRNTENSISKDFYYDQQVIGNFQPHSSERANSRSSNSEYNLLKKFHFINLLRKTTLTIYKALNTKFETLILKGFTVKNRTRLVQRYKHIKLDYHSLIDRITNLPSLGSDLSFQQRPFLLQLATRTQLTNDGFYTPKLKE